MGRGYVIEHCVSTLNSLRQEENYRVYITELLRTIAKGVGYDVKYRYSDLLNDTKAKPQASEERTSEEIITNIKVKAETIKNGFNDTGRQVDPRLK